MSGRAAPPPPFAPQQPTPMMMYMVPVLMPAAQVPAVPAVPAAAPAAPAPVRPPPPPAPGSPPSPLTARLDADIAELLAFESDDLTEDSDLSDSDDSMYSPPDISELNRCTTVQLAGRTDMCGICTEDITPSSIIRAIPCKHVFHIACLDRALEDRNSCPICRTQITAPAE